MATTLTRPFRILLGPCVSPAVRDAVEQAYPGAVIPGSIGLFGSKSPFVEPFYGDEANCAENKKQLKGARIVYVQSAEEADHASILHAGMMPHTLKRHGATEVSAILPFRAYDRQDRDFPNRFVSVGAEWYADLLKSSGADRVATVTPHSNAAQALYAERFGARNASGISVTSLLTDALKSELEAAQGQLIIGAPDGADKPNDAGQNRAREMVRSLFPGTEPGAEDAHMFKITKEHVAASETRIKSCEGDVAGKTCVIVDDMIDGGSTMVNAAEALKARGAARVIAMATHGILSGKAVERLLDGKDGKASAIDQLLITDTVPSALQKREAYLEQNPQAESHFRVVTVAPLVLEQIKRMELEKASPGYVRQY
jgi:ribose-phosphate pyrophosphokinase